MADISVEYINHMGDDLSVVNAARVSFSKQSEAIGIWPNELEERDQKLIRYLAKHNHEMPFAHPHITVRVKAPVPIARQAFKSKIGFVESEESRRYIKTTPEVYVPDVFRSAPEGSIKQGSGEAHKDSSWWRMKYAQNTKEAIELYEDMIRNGICPEQARFVLPQGAMVNWVWTGSLLAFARFYKLRSDAHAQQEVQVLARKVGEILGPLFPVSWEALTNAV
jgi:thymidylate synthase (FAD)